MIDPDYNRLSIRRQCELVSISRASFYRQPAGETTGYLELMRIIDAAFMETPWFLYLVAIMDPFSRKMLAWRLSNTMDADFCVAALEEAIARHGRSDIFNTDQGSQFTSFAFTLKDAGIRISMDGRGRWMDNVFIERLWRSLKYECVFLNAFETGSEARRGIGSWIDYYNRRRPHSSFNGRTPNEVYATTEMTEQLAA